MPNEKDTLTHSNRFGKTMFVLELEEIFRGLEFFTGMAFCWRPLYCWVGGTNLNCSGAQSRVLYGAAQMSSLIVAYYEKTING